MQQGKRYEVGVDNIVQNVLEFESYNSDLSFLNINNKSSNNNRLSSLYLGDLFAKEKMEIYKKRGQYNKFVLEKHHRFLWPLFSLLFTSVAILFYFNGSYNRKGSKYRDVFFSFLSFSFLLFYFLLKNSALNNLGFVLFMYLYVGLLFVLISFLYKKVK